MKRACRDARFTSTSRSALGEIWDRAFRFAIPSGAKTTSGGIQFGNRAIGLSLPIPSAVIGEIGLARRRGCDRGLQWDLLGSHPNPLQWNWRKMSDAKLPLIHKAPVEGLAIHVARTGLAIGDMAWLDRMSDGRVGVYARLKKPLFGVIPRQRDGLVGHLGPVAEEIIAPSLAHGDDLRVRIIDLTPEHLANGYPPEVYISVWGDPRHLQPALASVGLPPLPEATKSKPSSRLNSLRPA